MNKKFEVCCVVLLSLSIFVSLAMQPGILVYARAQAPAGGDWTSFTFDMNDSRYQAASTITSSNIGKLKEQWNITTGFSVTSTPLVSNGVVYFADWGGNIYSANVTDGSLIWKTNVGSPVSSTLGLGGGLIFVGFGPGNITKVDALHQNNGSMAWSTTIVTNMTAIWASPILYKGLVYIGVSSSGEENNRSWIGALYALNATSGQIVWNFNTMIGNTGGGGVWGSVVVNPNLNQIFFGTGNSYQDGPDSDYAYSIISLNAVSGALVWFHQFYSNRVQGHDFDFGSTPNLFSMIFNGNLYQAVGIGDKDGHYYVLNQVNGQLLENFTVGTSTAGGDRGPAGFYYPSGSVDPEVFIPSMDKTQSSQGRGVVEALFPSNGTVAWRDYTKGGLIGSVALVPGAVLEGDTTGRLYAFSTSDGTQLFVTKLPYAIEGGVTVAEGYVLVGDINLSVQGTGLGLFAFSVKN